MTTAQLAPRTFFAGDRLLDAGEGWHARVAHARGSYAVLFDFVSNSERSVLRLLFFLFVDLLTRARSSH